jgi:acetylornithine deacetylase/succinyl-diaminopimelate desuccinylase-like protein
MMVAGYKVNVIPREATASIDGRFLPGFEEEFEATIRELIGDEIEIEALNTDVAVEAPLDSRLIEVMASAIRSSDPGGRVIPHMISGGTDAKALSRLGIACYGFSPLRMPPDLDYWRLFHGVDERVPITGLHFGARVLDEFLRQA